MEDKVNVVKNTEVNPKEKPSRTKNDLTEYQAKFIAKLDFNITEKEVEDPQIDEEKRKVLKRLLNRGNDLPKVHRTNRRRVYSPLTALPRNYRKRVSCNGKTLIEIDAANSQPLLLANELKRNGYPVEKKLWQILLDGKFYEIINSNPRFRDDVKEAVFSFFHSKEINKNHSVYRELNKKYPQFIDSFEKYQKGRGSLAANLQGIESGIWIDKVSRLCMNLGIEHATVHDSVVFGGEENIDKVLGIIHRSFEINTPPLHIKTLAGEQIKHEYNVNNAGSVNLKGESTDGTVLICHTMNEWLEIAKRTAAPKKLFGDLFVQGETTFLFADSNVGKSLLACQIAESIASGRSIHPDIPVETEAQLVLYCDFEMQPKQIEKRYKGYNFSSYFIRYELSRDALISDSLEDAIYKEIEQEIKRTGAKVVIIDNITYIRSKTEKTDDAAKFMRQLNQLRAKEELSILVLTHTPKRDLRSPITANDMIGSKNLTNAADASFAIGKSSKGVHCRYIKQTKTRLGDPLYHEENVIDCEISVWDYFTGFQLNGFSPEFTHLKQITATSNRNAEIYELKQEGMTHKEIAAKLDIAEITSKKGYKRHQDELAGGENPF